jgi:hypothetical protein
MIHFSVVYRPGFGVCMTLVDGFGECDASVLSAGASDANREVSFAFGLIFGQ